jgi:hypothetical protein
MNCRAPSTHYVARLLRSRVKTPNGQGQSRTKDSGGLRETVRIEFEPFINDALPSGISEIFSIEIDGFMRTPQTKLNCHAVDAAQIHVAAIRRSNSRIAHGYRNDSKTIFQCSGDLLLLAEIS